MNTIKNRPGHTAAHVSGRPLAACVVVAAATCVVLAGCARFQEGISWRPSRPAWVPQVKLPEIKLPAIPSLSSESLLATDKSPPNSPRPTVAAKQTALARQAPASKPAPVARQAAAPDADPPLPAFKMPSPADYDQELAHARKLEQAGRFDEARSVYERLVQQKADRYEAHHRLGVLADRDERFLEAEAFYAKAIQLQGRNPEVFNDLGYSRYVRGKLDQAEKALLKAVALDPSEPQFRRNLGMVYGHQGRKAEALEQFRLAGTEAEAQTNLAVILAARDEVEGAKQCLRAALEAEPKHPAARRTLEMLSLDDAKPAESPEYEPEDLED